MSNGHHRGVAFFDLSNVEITEEFYDWLSANLKDLLRADIVIGGNGETRSGKINEMK